MKNLSRFFVGAASLVLLTACGPSKVSYAKFHEQAVAAVEKAPEYKKVTCKGEMTAASVSMKLDVVFEKKDSGWEMTKGDELQATVASSLILITADTVTEDDKTTYYAGNGFKAVHKEDNDNSTATWNSYGYLTSLKSDGGDMGKVDVKLTWSK